MQALIDFLPVIAFVATYWTTGNMSLAIGVIMVAVTLQLLGTWIIKREINRMLMASAALVVVLGGVSLLLDDPVFFKWKPTGLYWAFALVFLGSQWIGEKPIARRMISSFSEDPINMPDNEWRLLNLAWVGFFLFAGALNIYVAYQFDESTWVNFKLFGLFGITFVFLVLQSLWLARYMTEENTEEEGKD